MANPRLSDRIASAMDKKQTYDDNLSQFKDVLQNLVNSGVILFQDTQMPLLFPEDWAAYKAYLLSFKNALNVFKNSVPPEPDLNG